MIRIAYEKEQQRSAAYDGETQIGMCQYEVKENTWNIFHTEVDKTYGGQGIARKLVECVAAAAKEEGAVMAASCSYAAKVLGI